MQNLGKIKLNEDVKSCFIKHVYLNHFLKSNEMIGQSLLYFLVGKVERKNACVEYV